MLDVDPIGGVFTGEVLMVYAGVATDVTLPTVVLSEGG